MRLCKSHMNACGLSSTMRADYSTGVTKLAQFADYLVINISSPNTPGAWVAGFARPCPCLCAACVSPASAPVAFGGCREPASWPETRLLRVQER